MYNTKARAYCNPLYAIILKTGKMVKFLEKYILSRSSSSPSKPKESNKCDNLNQQLNIFPSQMFLFASLPNAKGIYNLVLHKFFQKIKKIEIKNIHPLIYEANKNLNHKPNQEHLKMAKIIAGVLPRNTDGHILNQYISKPHAAIL